MSFLLSDVLESSGYEVRQAATGAAARAVIEHHPPDLIILDLVLPDEDGLALCSMLSFWTGPDPERVDRLFRKSTRMRDKWERQDYRKITIAKALAGRTEFYKAALAFGGTLTAEHGIGLARRDFLELQRGPEAVRVMRSIKAARVWRGSMTSSM